MKKPLIGITLDNEDKGGYSKFPWYAIRHNYLHSIEKYGGIPFPLYHSNKNTSELFNILNGLSVVFITFSFFLIFFLFGIYLKYISLFFSYVL